MPVLKDPHDRTKEDAQMFASLSSSTVNRHVQRIRFWQHGQAVNQMLRAYPPGTDALIDQMHSDGFLRRFVLQRVVVPLYFARDQGWTVRGERGEMAAIIYLRRGEHQGIRVMHIDDINVDARYRRRGLAQRLMALAEDLARKEQRPFLKLAVTAANTPAVTLYRQLGYDDRDERKRYYTFDLSSSEPPSPVAPDLTLRPVRRRQATEALRRFYELELAVSVPRLARMLAAYYPLDVPKGAKWLYTIEQGGQQIGYGDAYLESGQWRVDLALRPELWGSEVERQAIQMLTSAIRHKTAGHESSSAVALHFPTAAHFDALCAGPTPLANELGLVEQHYDRIIMVKEVSLAAQPGR